MTLQRGVGHELKRLFGALRDSILVSIATTLSGKLFRNSTILVRQREVVILFRTRLNALLYSRRVIFGEGQGKILINIY